MQQRASSSRRHQENDGNAVRSRSVERFKKAPPQDDILEDLPYENQKQDSDQEPSESEVTPAARPRGRGRHRRSISDPFDAQEDIKKFTQEDDPSVPITPTRPRMLSSDFKLPTMPRFPHEESKNRNCFSEPPVNIFNVRGPSYFKDRKKTESQPYLLAGRGCDLFLTDNEQMDLHARLPNILGGQLRKLPSLAIVFRFPWGYMNLYFEIPDKLVPFMKEDGKPSLSSLTTAEKTLGAWLQGDEDYRNDRLKLIPFVAEGPWVVRNMVTGRPAIIGRKLPVSYDLMPGSEVEAPLLIATLDIGNSSAAAKRIVSVCRRYMSALTVDIGFVIQAEDPSELPEQMMGSIRVHHADPLKAPNL